LNGLPDTPTANIFDFFVGKIFDFVPFEYGNADGFAQMIYVKYFAEIDIAGVVAACNGVRGGEWANDGYTLGQHSEVNDVSLSMLSLSERAHEEKTYVCYDIVGFYVISKGEKENVKGAHSTQRKSRKSDTWYHFGGYLCENERHDNGGEGCHDVA